MAVRMHGPLSIQEILAQPKNTQLVEQLLGKEAALSRTGLARELCRRLDLRDSKGNDRLSTTCPFGTGAEQAIGKVFDGRFGVNCVQRGKVEIRPPA